MELHKLKKEELKGFDAAKLREAEKDIRSQLHDIRMDIYSGPGKHTGKVRALRKNLARVLTLQHASKLGGSVVGVRPASKSKKSVATKK
ncbi:MAG: 50S ribosomal protein L29 [Deltaproteobacteria bacterium]|nr:50S ribosomal protein L29 [Deltaproteobacteria bacterium]